MIAALYVESGGAYFDLPYVDPWDIGRDARQYNDPHPVIAHPPCQRWGRFWHGSTRKPHQFELGADEDCFEAALNAVRTWGGVPPHAIILPDLKWGPCEQRLHPTALAKYGYEKARRIGMMAIVGGKDKTKIRNSTPDEFRDLLISMVCP